MLLYYRRSQITSKVVILPQDQDDQMPSVCSNCVGVEVGDGLMYVPPERFPRARSGGCFAFPGARRPPGAEPLPARDSEPDTGNR